MADKSQDSNVRNHPPAAQPSLLDADRIAEATPISAGGSASGPALSATSDSPDIGATTENPATPRRRKSAKRRAPAKRISQSEDPGTDLRGGVGHVEFGEGALVRLRVPVRVNAEAGRDVLTDVDVLAIDCDLRLRVGHAILECKSGQSGAETDRLFWLSGLRHYVDADRAVLVRQTILSRGRGIAEKLDLNVLDMAKLEARETAQAWLPRRFAHLSGPGCNAAEKRMNIQLRGIDRVTADHVTFLRDEALLGPPHRIVSALNGLGESMQGAPPLAGADQDRCGEPLSDCASCFGSRRCPIPRCPSNQ